VAPQPHILLVEDDAVVAFAVEDFLKQHGFLVAVAATADGARTRLAAARHDVMIADLRLGEGDNLDGLDLAEAALRGDRVDHVVLLTAYSTDATVTRAAVLGVAAVVRKPVPLTHLRDLLGSLLAGEGGDR
jgi:DNA-binding NarL/FixJ family response regulator